MSDNLISDYLILEWLLDAFPECKEFADQSPVLIRSPAGLLGVSSKNVGPLLEDVKEFIAKRLTPDAMLSGNARKEAASIFDLALGRHGGDITDYERLGRVAKELHALLMKHSDEITDRLSACPALSGHAPGTSSVDVS